MCPSYLDHNLPFNIYTDASSYQLGAGIFQKYTPVAFYSHKLSAAQQNYTAIEKELLLVNATINKFHLILFGAEIHIFKGNYNIAFTTLTTQHFFWHLFIEDFYPTFHYLKGTDNDIVDTLSGLPCNDTWLQENQNILTPTMNSFFFPIPLSNDITLPLSSQLL